jgi:CheY-like chemotaxis protein
MEKVDPSESLYADLKAICDAARRSSEITRQLLAFARKQTISPKVIDVNKTVEGTLNMIRHLIGEDIHLEWMPGTGLWPLKIDPSQLDQVLANLCVNARDAIRDVGKVVIETGNVTFDKAFCADHPEFCQGDFVMLQVSDNGRGMDKETLDNIFEPFFTTKEVGQGTGLGLAMVHGIVKQNEGFINVYSEPGKGAAFKIYLPRHEGPIGEAAKRGVAPVPRGRGETVLVVEDDGLILKLAEKILLGLDYTVLTAGTSDEALGFARQHAGRIHLLITDVIMPMMNGRELANQVQQLCPDIKTLFMSGYTANIIAHRGVLDEGINFIQKPFSIQNLANAVRNLLDA